MSIMFTHCLRNFCPSQKFGSGLIFCVFASVASILIGKDDEYEKNAYKNVGLRVQGHWVRLLAVFIYSPSGRIITLLFIFAVQMQIFFNETQNISVISLKGHSTKLH